MIVLLRLGECMGVMVTPSSAGVFLGTYYGAGSRLVQWALPRACQSSSTRMDRMRGSKRTSNGILVRPLSPWLFNQPWVYELLRGDFANVNKGAEQPS